MDPGFVSPAGSVATAGQPLPLDSPVYIPRGDNRANSLEAKCGEAIANPGGLLRIRGAQGTGKTSLLHHLAAARPDYASAYCSLASLKPWAVQGLDEFLQDFCAQVTAALQLPNQLGDYWDDLFGSTISCKSYFEEYLLPTLGSPLVLLLDDVDSLFPVPHLADEFFGLLRAWHEDAKSRDVWGQLRLVVAHTMEVYIPLNVNKSPFNVGVPVELSPFQGEEICLLAAAYGFDLTAAEGEQLQQLVGGWPQLVHIALNQLGQGLTIAELADAIASAPEPYGQILERQAAILANDPPLASAWAQVIKNQQPVSLAPPLALKLQSLGLVSLHQQAASPSCLLYLTHLA